MRGRWVRVHVAKLNDRLARNQGRSDSHGGAGKTPRRKATMVTEVFSPAERPNRAAIYGRKAFRTPSFAGLSSEALRLCRIRCLRCRGTVRDIVTHQTV